MATQSNTLQANPYYIPKTVTIQTRYYKKFREAYQYVKEALDVTLLLQQKQVYYLEQDFEHIIILNLQWNTVEDEWRNEQYVIPCNKNYQQACKYMHAGVYRAIYEAPPLGTISHDMFY